MRTTILSCVTLGASLTMAMAETSGLEAYLARVDAAEAGFADACDALRENAPPEGLVWVRLGANGVEIAPADQAAAEAAAFWAEAALGARLAATALYGQAAGESLKTAPVMIEAKSGGVTVHDGKAMTLGDPCDAMTRLLAALGDGAAGDPFAAARAAAASTERIAVPIGGEMTISLASAPEDAIVRAPDGVEARIENTDDGRNLTLAARADAAPGDGAARIYAPGDPFRPIEEIDLKILPGAAPPPAANGGALAIGERRAGSLSIGGEDEFTVEVSAAGRFRFVSGGDTDVMAVLESESGARISADDDSGDGYGFAFSANLAPGRYVLRLRHCCGGGGQYSVSASPE